jgi:ribonuclease HI
MRIIHADGICEPNPGKAAWAFVELSENGTVVYERYEYLSDRCTNNVAEYMAVGKALNYAQKTNDKFTIYTDSQLVVQQVSGKWNCNKRNLMLMRDRVRQLMEQTGAELKWVSGAENRADEYTRIAYEKATGIYPQPRKKKSNTPNSSPTRITITG